MLMAVKSALWLRCTQCSVSRGEHCQSSWWVHMLNTCEACQACVCVCACTSAAHSYCKLLDVTSTPTLAGRPIAPGHAHVPLLHWRRWRGLTRPSKQLINCIIAEIWLDAL